MRPAAVRLARRSPGSWNGGIMAIAAPICKKAAEIAGTDRSATWRKKQID
jgi:hypothetical protein